MNIITKLSEIAKINWSKVFTKYASFIHLITKPKQDNQESREVLELVISNKNECSRILDIISKTSITIEGKTDLIFKVIKMASRGINTTKIMHMNDIELIYHYMILYPSEVRNISESLQEYIKSIAINS